MGNESWTIERIDDGWADLRQGEFLYCVPVSDLPQNVKQGDRLRAPSGSSTGTSRWVTEGPKVRTA